MLDFLDVEKFHAKFGLPMAERPRPMPKDAWLFRNGFLHEELSEFEEACINEQFVHAVDALLDLNYVVYGTALFIGVPRHGTLSGWTSFDAVIDNGRSCGMSFPRRPEFLHEHMYLCLRAQMYNDITGFERAHIAAEFGVLNAIELALLHLHALSRTVYATAALMGVPWGACWAQVQKANMAKERAKHDGSNSKRGTPWDIVKPEGWVAPDAAIADILIDHGHVLPEGTMTNYATGKVEYPQGE